MRIDLSGLAVAILAIAAYAGGISSYEERTQLSPKIEPQKYPVNNPKGKQTLSASA